MNCISRLLPFLAVPLLYGASANQPPGLLSDPVDISSDFHEFSNTYFLADRLAAFDPAKARAASCGGASGSTRRSPAATAIPAPPAL